MNLGSVSLSQATAAIESTSTRSSSAPAVLPSSDERPPSGRVSAMGQMLGRLHELAETSPEDFQAAAAEISSQLQELADATGGEEGEHLAALAEKFARASESGDFGALAPPGGRPEGPPPRGAGAYAAGQEPSAPASELHSQVRDLIEQVLNNAGRSGETEA